MNLSETSQPGFPAQSFVPWAAWVQAGEATGVGFCWMNVMGDRNQEVDVCKELVIVIDRGIRAG